MALAEYKAFLRGRSPAFLLKAESRKIMRDQGNKLLRVATQGEVDINDLSIDEDCLPTWPGRFWAPEGGLHSLIQQRLAMSSVTRDLRDMVYNDLHTKGNEKLDKARELGIPLGDIRMGKDLLPTWPGSDTRPATQDKTILATGEEQSMDKDEEKSQRALSDAEDADQDYEMADGDVDDDYEIIDILTGHESRTGAPTVQPIGVQVGPCFPPTLRRGPFHPPNGSYLWALNGSAIASSSSESDSDEDWGADDSSDDVLSLRDFVEDGRGDYTDGTENIFHDAEIIDGPRGTL